MRKTHAKCVRVESSAYIHVPLIEFMGVELCERSLQFCIYTYTVYVTTSMQIESASYSVEQTILCIIIIYLLDYSFLLNHSLQLA